MPNLYELLEIYEETCRNGGEDGYRKIISDVRLYPVRTTLNDQRLLVRAWAHLHLREFKHARQIFRFLYDDYPPDSLIGRSVVEGLTQTYVGLGEIERAKEKADEIPQCLSCRSIKTSILLLEAQKGLHISMKELGGIISNTLEELKNPKLLKGWNPIIGGNILSDSAYAIHFLAGKFEEFKAEWPFSRDLMCSVVDIYEDFNAPRINKARAFDRTSLICEALGEIESAKVAAGEAFNIWNSLVSTTGCYSGNLEGAKRQFAKLVAV